MGKQEIFISWSGERSKQIAEHLQYWLRRIIPTLKPFISTKDVEKGTFWFTEIKEKLSETNLGIICLTAENKDKPWILFEAGALSKGLSISRVCTFLIDIEPKDIIDPLARFNHTILEKDSFYQLVATINNSLGDNKIDNDIIRDTYNDFWKNFYNRCQDIIKNTNIPNSKNLNRSNDEIVADILNITRDMDKKVNLLVDNYENQNIKNDKQIIIQFEITTINRDFTMEAIVRRTKKIDNNVFLGISENTNSIGEFIIYLTFCMSKYDIDKNIKSFISSFSQISGVIDVKAHTLSIYH